VEDQSVSPIDFSNHDTTFFCTSISWFPKTGRKRPASCRTIVVQTWMLSCRVLKTKRNKSSFTLFKMNLSRRAVGLVQNKNVSVLDAINFLYDSLELGVIHLVYTDQEAGLTSTNIVLVHPKLHGLHQLSLLFDWIRLTKMRVIFTTIASNNHHGNHLYYFEV